MYLSSKPLAMHNAGRTPEAAQGFFAAFLSLHHVRLSHFKFLHANKRRMYRSDHEIAKRNLSARFNRLTWRLQRFPRLRF